MQSFESNDQMNMKTWMVSYHLCACFSMLLYIQYQLLFLNMSHILIVKVLWKLLCSFLGSEEEFKRDKWGICVLGNAPRVCLWLSPWPTGESLRWRDHPSFSFQGCLFCPSDVRGWFIGTREIMAQKIRHSHVFHSEIYTLHFILYFFILLTFQWTSFSSLHNRILYIVSIQYFFYLLRPTDHIWGKYSFLPILSLISPIVEKLAASMFL